MKLYSTTREALRRLIDRDRPTQTVEKRTYVFVFVPVDFRRNDDDANEQRLDDELMWTWFLPNPLSPPKEQK